MALGAAVPDGEPGTAAALPQSAVVGALMVLITAPFWGAPLPELIDYPSHLARWHVMLNPGDPWLARAYAFTWRPVGNLGTDLLAIPLGHLFGVEAAGRIIAAAIPALTVYALHSLARALGRPLGLGFFMALPFVLARPYLMGFLNFSLALALAYLAFASWLRRGGWPWWWLALAAWLLWLCHMAGWAIFAVMAGGAELAVRRSPRELVVRLWPLAMPAVTLLQRHGSAHEPMADVLRYKAIIWTTVLGTNLLAIGVLALTLTISTIAFALRSSGRFDWRAGLPAIMLGALAILLPPAIVGGDLADLRLVPATLTLAALALDWPANWRFKAAFVVLIGAQVASLAVQWHAFSTDAARSLGALELIPRGARVRNLVLLPPGDDYSAQFGHVSGYAVVRRDALVNSNFALEGIHLLTVKAPGFADPSQLIALEQGTRAVKVDRALSPRDEYLWIFTAGIAVRTPAGARLIFSSKDSALYRLR